MRLFGELKRRKVLQTAAIYVAMSWLLLQVAELLLDMFDVPEWGLRLILLVLLLGFPLALVLSWMHRLTPHGLQRELDTEESHADPSATTRDLSARAPVEIPPPSAQSIAVLPFTNMSEDRANEFFSDGLSEELLNLLSRIPGLRVVARTSSFSFKGRSVSAAEIARELKVAHLLEGSVRKAGNRIRIAVQLIRATDSTHVWAQSFDRDLGDIFAVQDEIAAAVVGELELQLMGHQAPKAPQTDPRAYSSYLQGRHFFEMYSSEGYEQALAALNAAIEIDPDFAPAWATLGALYWSGANNSLIDYDEGLRKAREVSARALAIDPDQAEALSLLAVFDVIENRDVASGIQRLEHAVELEPHNQRVLTRAGIVARRRGRLDEAIRYGERALKWDPLSPNAYAALGYCYYLAGRLDEAEVMRRKVLALSPGWLSGHYYLGRILLARSEPERALVAMEQEPSYLWRQTGLALVYHVLGEREASEVALDELKTMNPIGIFYQLAEVHAFRGEIDAAFQSLERAFETHDSGLTDVVTDPLLLALHQDPRWPDVLARAGLQE